MPIELSPDQLKHDYTGLIPEVILSAFESVGYETVSYTHLTLPTTSALCRCGWAGDR